MDKNDERMILVENLISKLRNDNITLMLVIKELELLRFEKITTEQLKFKLLELLELAIEMKVIENLCLNGLAKL